jgi:hypothetical protein
MTLAFVRRMAPKSRLLAIDVSLERLNLAQTLLAKADSLKQMYPFFLFPLASFLFLAHTHTTTHHQRTHTRTHMRARTHARNPPTY